MARYTPGNVPMDLASMSEFLRSELAKIAQAMETPDDRITLETLYAPPNKYGEGTTVKADGVSFNPGSGGGTYQYRGGAWRFLG
jgi:hypothetical protein